METVKEYLDISARLFITDNQLLFSANVCSSVRVKQSEKHQFSDPCLACALLNATQASLMGDLETLGFLFKALCERDLKIYAESFGRTPQQNIFFIFKRKLNRIQTESRLRFCVPCGMANAVYQRPDGVFVVPITALKN